MSMYKILLAALLLCLALGGLGCGSNQTVKDAWQGTRSFWYSNVSVPASIDYDETGDLSAYEAVLAKNMVGIDLQLTGLEKVMINADRPPTSQWLSALFGRFPWINGVAGVRSDGTILAQNPGPSLKPLDFAPLLLEDSQQNFRALRANVQDTPMGPEVFIASPLYDAHTFLGIIAVYFDMRMLLSFSESPNDIVIFSPQAVLWAGKYDFAATPMAGIEWDNVTFETSAGSVSNETGSFYWTVRYFANQPIIFAVAMKGAFPEADNPLNGPTFSSGFVASDPFVLKPYEAVVPEESIEQAAEVAEVPEEIVEQESEMINIQMGAPSQAPQPVSQPVRRRAVMIDVPDVEVPAILQEQPAVPAGPRLSPIRPAPASRADSEPELDPELEAESSDSDSGRDDDADTSEAASGSTYLSPIHPAPASSSASDSEDTSTEETVEDSSAQESEPYRAPSPFGPR